MAQALDLYLGRFADYRKAVGTTTACWVNSDLVILLPQELVPDSLFPALVTGESDQPFVRVSFEELVNIAQVESRGINGGGIAGKILEDVFRGFSGRAGSDFLASNQVQFT